MTSPRIALAIDDLDWHARELITAFESRRAPAVPIRLHDIRFDSAASFGLVVPGFGETLPDAVLVRSISAGSFEAVTRRLGVLHAFGRLGVTVWNEATAIERCVDKSMTTFLLATNGIATPRSWTVEGRDKAVEVVRNADGPLVLKPLFGSQGKGLRLVRDASELPDEDDVGAVYYLQTFEGDQSRGYADFRVFVCAGEVVAAMTRRSPHWITNVRQGGCPEVLVPDAEITALALEAAECVGAQYAGVDLLRLRDGTMSVIEVNSMPGWKGLQSVASVSIAKRVAEALLASLA